MPRYIDVDALISKVCGYYCGCERTECGMEEINEPCKRVSFIEDAPTISPDEVRGVGEWEDAKQHGLCRCSVCKDCYIEKDYITQAKWRYCPNCGARLEVSEDA